MERGFLHALNTGASEGDFIPTGGGGLDSPFDVLFRANDDLVTSINTDDILRYDPTGAPLGVFATNIPFGEQMCLAMNGNVLTTNGSGVHEVARPGGGIVETKFPDVSARFIEYAEIGSTPVEPTTWGAIKDHFRD